MDSLALAIARKLTAARMAAIPPRSRREFVYLRFVRPAFRKFLGPRRGPTQLLSMRSRPFLERDHVREVLMIKCDHIGDFFLALPAMSIIKRGFPRARMTLLCGSWNRDLALRSELFDQVLCTDVFSELASAPPPSFDLKMLGACELPDFDVAIDLRINPETRFLLDHISARLKAGFECDQTKLDFAFAAPFSNLDGRVNFASHAQRLLVSFAHSIVSLFDTERAAYHALIPYIRTPAPRLPRPGKGPLVGINTRSGVPTKDWPLARYIEVMLQLINQHDATIVLLGSKRQHTDGEAILRNLGNAARNVVNLIGMLTLAELPGVVHQFDLYVGPDTGTTHLAALLGRKTLCLHAGVSPIESFGPIGPNAVVVKCVNLPCAPCGIQELSGCAHNHRCMRSITAETITHEIEEMLASEEVRAAGSFASFGA